MTRADEVPPSPSPAGGGSPDAQHPAGWGEPRTGTLSHDGPATGKSRAPGLSRFRRKTAQVLRENTTEAERKLWRALRTRLPLEGSHFRRQVPIGPYVADFACLAARLVIELDGGHHSEDTVAARDRIRQDWLEAEGYRVLRFWNSEIVSNLDGVLDTIYAVLHGGLAAEPKRLVHTRRARTTPPRPQSGRPSPSRGG